MSVLLRTEKLSRDFGRSRVLDRVDISIESGKIIGLLGPNGAGKTTLIKIINGLLQPSEGMVEICDKKPGTETKKLISYLPDRVYFAEWMKIKDVIDMFDDFYEDFDRKKAEDMCATLGLNKNQVIKTLSKGMKEKMQLMLVMSRNAKLYILDEPIGGVDPATRDFILKTIISNYAEDSSVLISTHLISDVEQILDEVILLNKGNVLLQDSVDSIRENKGKSIDDLFRDIFRMYAQEGGDENVG